ncbi:DUF3231 family protein [Oceanobacillus sp. Castelsardo]|uniref:DUF3231 family protein n=1 Tax=Oceanobacillus sp. Castelsardo TaxID=1851204 RepID=UPI00083928F7|nr:DUF3231 family protein [Oceanobacillus sp. Castelsardo]
MEQKKPLTASELADIWGKYVNDSLSIAVLSYFNQKVEDPEIKEIISDALQLTRKHFESIKPFFHEEKRPLPTGITKEDVDITKGRLYTDNYMLQNCLQFGMLGMQAATAAVTMTTREDLYDFFTKVLNDYNQFHHKTLAVMKAKGVLSESPTIPAPKEIDFVKKQNFLTGWFGEKRPLLSVEISHLFGNLQRNSLGAATLTGFGQVAEKKEVRDFFLRGIEIAKKHVEIFSDVLESSDVPVPMGSDALVTELTDTGVSSDKLMMLHTTGMIGLGIGFYGLSISTNTRRDIASHYARLSGEIALYAEDGTNLMIKHGWLEEPPRMVDRGELIKTKGGK